MPGPPPPEAHPVQLEFGADVVVTESVTTVTLSDRPVTTLVVQDAAPPDV